ncbi:hypothetical protein SAMN05216368_10729 [Cryobacterium flavum]|uniref:Uncharacterized protein n=1 Tax=Cryobacterium flavum TaxID=1424659 RepID=A0A4R8V2E9_9MICO|nr:MULTISPECIES: hypothetical protein [Cryobacterium]TFB75529.1 hypothetical protein E3O21_11895 [Cryobacterium flavum]TFD08759.1 hypothetical protein E3T35_15215 [Cryobacterium sp. TMT1-2-2]SDN73010.1 hypothetical protein SAMN05216368_10729 [Cryobacterium flavum]
MTSVAPGQPDESRTVTAPAPPVGTNPTVERADEPAPYIARPYRALERELERAVRDRAEVNLRVTAAVTAMHDGGGTWAAIARILGTAPQTAHKKYSKPRPARTTTAD